MGDNLIRSSRSLRYEKALTEFDQVIRSKPCHPQAHYEKGSLLFDLGRFEEALVALERAAELGLKIRGLHYKIGLAYWNLNWCDYQEQSNCG
ncbi:MAG: tetratricopeptide repeat protein [bacterium]